MVGPAFTGGIVWPSSMQKLANHLPAVRLMVTSRTEPRKRSSSTMDTRPILGRVTALPSTRTVSGPLSARKPCSCLRRLNRGNPRRRPDGFPTLTALHQAPQASAAWPRSMIAYLAAFWDSADA